MRVINYSTKVFNNLIFFVYKRNICWNSLVSTVVFLFVMVVVSK